jgi:hypothetical protein
VEVGHHERHDRDFRQQEFSMRRMSKWVAAAVIAMIGLGATAGAASAYTPKPQYPVPHYPGPYNPGPFPPRHLDNDYVVYVKHPFSGGWRFYGKFETRQQAERAEWRLERQGLRAHVERVRDYRPFPW